MNKEKNKSKAVRFLVVILIIMAVVIALLFVRNRSKDRSLLETDSQQTVSASAESSGQEKSTKNSGTISIPGYGGLNLKAGHTEQELVLPNPSENNCLFVISLYLEDGTLLWKSDDVKPGENSKPIVLNSPLEKGIYENALLHYDCFTDDGSRSPLNGAEAKLTLHVD